MRMRKEKMNLALVGFGYWGPNLLRNFLMTKEAQVAAVCDKDPEKLGRISYPGILKTEKFDDLLDNDKIDAIVLAIPTELHYPCAKKALEAGKDVWVEKPLTDSTQKAMELHQLALEKERVLFVDHTFVYNPAVQKMREVIDKGLLGNLFYYDSTRVNLGLIQKDINVVWDLAPHDLSILNYLVRQTPVEISAFGACHTKMGREEMAYVHLRYENGMIAHFNFNWLSPVKIRRIIVGGSQRLLVYDDGETTEKIKLYDKGVNVDERLGEEGKYRFMVNYRMGDMTAPYVEHTEPLLVACRSFVNAALHRTPSLSDGMAGVQVVQLLETINTSLKEGGKKIVVKSLK